MEHEKLNIFDPNIIYSVQLPNGKSRPLSHDELMNLTLNSPNSIPELHGKKTWISNYVGTFWMPFMKPGPFAVYFQLVKMAYGDKDHAFPSVPYLAMLLGVSERTVQSYIDHLVDLGFVIVLERRDAQTNKQLSNLYLLSNTIPFISKAQYEKLPKRLQQEHDRFMEYIKFKKIMHEEHIPDYHS
jgi:biotin operon repressor